MNPFVLSSLLLAGSAFSLLAEGAEGAEGAEQAGDPIQQRWQIGDLWEYRVTFFVTESGDPLTCNYINKVQFEREAAGKVWQHMLVKYISPETQWGFFGALGEAFSGWNQSFYFQSIEDGVISTVFETNFEQPDLRVPFSNPVGRPFAFLEGEGVRLPDQTIQVGQEELLCHVFEMTYGWPADEPELLGDEHPFVSGVLWYPVGTREVIYVDYWHHRIGHVGADGYLVNEAGEKALYSRDRLQRFQPAD
ncbi:MAG: hypothetical protein AAF555_06495 [Verrucomicrobiota bacterium]